MTKRRIALLAVLWMAVCLFACTKPDALAPDAALEAVGSSAASLPETAAECEEKSARPVATAAPTPRPGECYQFETYYYGGLIRAVEESEWANYIVLYPDGTGYFGIDEYISDDVLYQDDMLTIPAILNDDGSVFQMRVSKSKDQLTLTYLDGSGFYEVYRRTDKTPPEIVGYWDDYHDEIQEIFMLEPLEKIELNQTLVDNEYGVVKLLSMWSDEQEFYLFTMFECQRGTEEHPVHFHVGNYVVNGYTSGGGSTFDYRDENGNELFEGAGPAYGHEDFQKGDVSFKCFTVPKAMVKPSGINRVLRLIMDFKIVVHDHDNTYDTVWEDSADLYPYGKDAYSAYQAPILKTGLTLYESDEYTFLYLGNTQDDFFCQRYHFYIHNKTNHDGCFSVNVLNIGGKSTEDVYSQNSFVVPHQSRGFFNICYTGQFFEDLGLPVDSMPALDFTYDVYGSDYPYAYREPILTKSASIEPFQKEKDEHGA